MHDVYGVPVLYYCYRRNSLINRLLLLISGHSTETRIADVIRRLESEPELPDATLN